MFHSSQPFTSDHDLQAESSSLKGSRAVVPSDWGNEPAYSMIASAPPPAAEEVELTDVPAIEVYVCWGNSVLHVAHLSPPRAYYVGEKSSDHEPCDYELPSERLGATRLPLLVGGSAGLLLVLPRDATGYVQSPAAPLRTVEELRRGAAPCFEAPGATSVPFEPGMRARIELSGLVFRIASVRAGRPAGRGVLAMDLASLPYFGLSLAVHTSLLAALAFFTPRLGLADEEALDRDRLYVMQQYLDGAAERQRLARESAVHPSAEASEGATGARAPGSEGQLGNPTAAAAPKRYAIRGPRDNKEVQLSREVAREEAAGFGMVGILSALAADPNSPTAPWGRDLALGSDEVSARGGMWGDAIGEAFGVGGLGLTSTGEGSGGPGAGIGVGHIGVGHGEGLGTSDGFGNGVGRLSGTRAPRKLAGMRPGQTTVSGRLPSEVIQRIVRQNFGRFRLCYSQGLTRNPNLEGRVAARFVISRDGSVSSVSNGGSDLPDGAVTSCVLSAFYGLTFPQPENGIVTVVYPILLAPG